MTKQFHQSRFETINDRSDFFVSQVQRLRHPEEQFTLLDVGCGNGGHVLKLAQAFPRAVLHGLDVSPDNVRAAQAAGQAFGARVTFETADFMHWQGVPADILISDSTLHLISGDTHKLVRNLAQSNGPGGALLFSIPVECLYNKILFLVRRFLCLLRSPMLNSLMLSAAKLVYRKGCLNEAALKDRIEYMYIMPERLFSKELVELFQQEGLCKLSCVPEPQHYLLKPRHVFAVYQKRLSERKESDPATDQGSAMVQK